MTNAATARDPIATGKLRLLETTDLHMHLRGYDYFSDRDDDGMGLSGLIDVIAGLRADPHVTTLLFDNGDFLQGNPLADHVAATLAKDDIHPMIAAMNLLEYDAITLGNHEFDYGLAFLRRILSRANCPVVSANISCPNSPAPAQPFDILTPHIRCDDGTLRVIKIGVTGFAPPQSTDWDYAEDAETLFVDGIVKAAQRVIPEMQAAGADVIVALCHSGIGGDTPSDDMENAAQHLAAVDGIDAVLMGHTHEIFPDTARPVTDVIDAGTATLHGKPSVMAGFYGRCLGVIDLDLQWQADAWRIAGHQVWLEKPRTGTTARSLQKQQLDAISQAAHKATLTQMRKPLCRTHVHLQSYFATVQPDLIGQLLAQITQDAVRAQVAETQYSDTPILAAVAPFRFGGRSGLGHYIDIPSGVMRLRDAAAIFPFTDALCAVQRTGGQIRTWLERSASHYNQVDAGKKDQPLINPLSAGYHCDALYGLTYQIDLTQPPRFDPNGQVIAARANRITALERNGVPIHDDDIFVVGTNSFRAQGGGGFQVVPRKDMIWTSPDQLRDVLTRALRERGDIADQIKPNWAFKPAPQTTALFQSAPEARAHMPDTIEHAGPGHDGFDTYRIIL